jgi:dihydroflavonol-4-reductase
LTGRSFLVTGGQGFLGQHIVVQLRDGYPDAQIRVLDLARGSTMLPVGSLPGVQIHLGDLRAPETFAATLEGVDTVIHSAAMVSFRRRDRDAILRTNVDGTLSLLQMAAARGCARFVLMSSISSIGRAPGRLSDESMTPDLEDARSKDPYGYSKLVAEQAIRAEMNHLDGIILNPSVILGPGSRRIQQVVKRLRWLPVIPMLGTMNSFVDVRDVAAAVVMACAKGRSGERYIVTAANVDMVTFARRALSVLGRQAMVVRYPRSLLKLGDAGVWLLDALRLNPGIRRLTAIHVDKAYTAEKIRQEMGWTPAHTLDQTLRDTLLVS